MSGSQIGLVAKAKKKAKHLRKLRKDIRYLKTIGKLRNEGLLLEVLDIPKFRGRVFLKDALWAAELEPRVYELLPAIIVKRPKFFDYLQLPEDLGQVVKEIKRGNVKSQYNGIEPQKYLQWIDFVGRKDIFPGVMKSFRLTRSDLSLLNQIAEKTGDSYTDILRKALRSYAK